VTVLVTVVWRREGVRRAKMHTLLLGLALLPMVHYLTFGKPATWLGLGEASRSTTVAVNGVAVSLTLNIWGMVVLRRTHHSRRAHDYDAYRGAAGRTGEYQKCRGPSPQSTRRGTGGMIRTAEPGSHGVARSGPRGRPMRGLTRGSLRR